MDNIKVIGIDPAPSKKSTIFDGENFCEKNYNELIEYLDFIKKEHKKVLICWDAPLSFSLSSSSPFTKRDIEKFFSQKKWCKTPTGISVLGYAGCPHWAISQYILGYPKISNFEKCFEPPFKLVFENEITTHSVTEVHPAVAIWLWCKNDIDDFRYKKGKQTVSEWDNVFGEILEILVNKGILNEDIYNKIEKLAKAKKDDYLDAYVAWKLGSDWINKKTEPENKYIKILGDNKTGSFLLPYNKELFEKFDKFIKPDEKEQSKKNDKIILKECH